MESKKQMYLRFIFNNSFTRKDILSSMKYVLEDHIKGIVVNTNNQPDSFDIILESPIDRDQLSILISTSIIDYVKRNFITFKKIYEEHLFNTRELKNFVIKDDLVDVLLNSESNKFLFNLNIFNDSVRVTFR